MSPPVQTPIPPQQNTTYQRGRGRGRGDYRGRSRGRGRGRYDNHRGRGRGGFQHDRNNADTQTTEVTQTPSSLN